MNRTRHAESTGSMGKCDDLTANDFRERVRSVSQLIHVPKEACKDSFGLVEPQIDANGNHTWPFDRFCPADVLFLTVDSRRQVRMNRHEYFEILYLCSGSAICHIHDRLLPVNAGDLVIVGSTFYHRIEVMSSTPIMMAALFFEPDLIRGDGGSDAAEYLTPFFSEDPTFPHVVPAKTQVPREVLEMMVKIRTQLPVGSQRSRLAVKTYLKMILMLLVNHFASHTGSLEALLRHERALERLSPLFLHISQNCGTPISVRDAGRICGMSASHFMNFFKRLTGMSFSHYLNQYRIVRAQALLTGTEELLTDIAQELGFCDQSYFGSVFRKYVGVTPADYRRQFRNPEVPTASLEPQPHEPPTHVDARQQIFCLPRSPDARADTAGRSMAMSAVVAGQNRSASFGGRRLSSDRPISRRKTGYEGSVVFAT